MIILKAKKRSDGKLRDLRKKELIPAVLYGPGIKNLNLGVGLREFKKAYKGAGESSLISLEIEDQKKFLVLIHDIQLESVSGKPIHIDFYQPALKEEAEIMVPIVFDGEAPVVKNMGGTLVKNISEIEVKALPQNLPKNIKVDIGALKNFEDIISVGDLKIPEGVRVSREAGEILVSVSAPEKVEEEIKEVTEEKPDEAKKEEVKEGEKPKEEEKKK